MFDIARFREYGLTEGEKHFRRLADAIECGESPPAETLQFLANAGRRIANGENPKKALKLEKRKGNKMDGSRVWRRIRLVQAICLLIDDFHLTKAEAIDKTAAALADIPGYSRDSLERHYDAFHGLARESNRAEKLFADFLARQETPKI